MKNPMTIRLGRARGPITPLIIWLSIGFAQQLSAQPVDCEDCNCLFAQAQISQKRGYYKQALNLLIAARGYCVDSIERVDESLRQVYLSIEHLRLEAIRTRVQAEQARDSLKTMLDRVQATRILLEKEKENSEKTALLATEHRIRADSLRDLAEQLVDAFYFFEDSLALALNDGKFGYVNKEGRTIVPYQYDKAENYLSVGLARVWREETTFLVNREGEEVQVNGIEVFNTPRVGLEVKIIFDIHGTRLAKLCKRLLPNFNRNPPTREHAPKRNRGLEKMLVGGQSLFATILTRRSMKDSVKVLDLASLEMSKAKARLYQLRAIEVLLMGSNRLERLDYKFLRLKELRVLDLSRNMLTSLPDGFSKLQNLEELDLSHNQLKEFPFELLEIPNLKRVYLQGNPFISRNDLDCLKEALTRCWPNCVWHFD